MSLTRRSVLGSAGVLLMKSAGPAGAEAAMDNLPFAATTPTHIGKVGLVALDADGLADYYKAVLGLTELTRSPDRIVLGAGDRALLEIERSPSAKPDDPRSAGLYHTAFLLPSRADLARWTRHAIDKRIPVAGASDHFVSEAIYLTDPEGNGIEIYADRPHENWDWDGSFVRMGTEALDVPDLLGVLAPADPGWRGAPQGSVVGHVHLRVGDANAAEQWWNSEMGFETVQSLGGSAVFLSTGGYHHHVGANSWQSRGAGPRQEGGTGLAWVELATKDAPATTEKRDPWGTLIRTVAA